MISACSADDGGERQADVVIGAASDRDRDPGRAGCRASRRPADGERASPWAQLTLRFFARKRSAHLLFGRNSAGTRARITEMLSRPPFWLASSISSARGHFERCALLVDDAVHDLGVDHVGQAVRAQQVDVVGLDAIFGDVGRHDRLDAERPRHQVLVERKSRLLGGEQAAVDLLLQQRVIARQLLEATAAQPIAARIADMADADTRLP